VTPFASAQVVSCRFKSGAGFTNIRRRRALRKVARIQTAPILQGPGPRAGDEGDQGDADGLRRHQPSGSPFRWGRHQCGAQLKRRSPGGTISLKALGRSLPPVQGEAVNQHCRQETSQSSVTLVSDLGRSGRRVTFRHWSIGDYCYGIERPSPVHSGGHQETGEFNRARAWDPPPRGA
jgi:hypothetical protein